MLADWPKPVFTLVAARLWLLADPTRVALLVCLEQGEAGVRELADQVDATPQNASHHLNILARAGLVTRRREGTLAYYALADYTTCRLLEQAFQSVCGQVDELSDLVKLDLA